MLAVNPGAQWAWERMGAAQAAQGNSTDSIVSLQRAIRCDKRTASCWAELANSYCEAGKYESAVKARPAKSPCRVLGLGGLRSLKRKANPRVTL